MPTLIVKAKKLNKRSRIPANFPDLDTIAGIVKEGYIFEGKEVPAEEMPNPGLGAWYVDRDRFYYWGGGVNTVVPAAAPGFTFDSAKMSWAHSELMIIDIWNDAQVAGRNVRVAILEEGFEIGHNDLRPALSENFFTGEGRKGHGTEMAGIIGAKGNKVFGIAPECEMLFGKINFDDSQSIVSGLKWAHQSNADVISLSFKCKFHQDIEDELQKCSDKGIAVVAAIGNSGQLNEVIDNVYPARSPFCFSIGCFGRNFMRMPVSNRSNNLELLAPSEDILTTMIDDNNGRINGDTSLATAFVSGSVALLLSVSREMGKNFSGKTVAEALCTNADKRNNGNDDRNVEYGFGLIDLFKTYSAIKQTI